MTWEEVRKKIDINYEDFKKKYKIENPVIVRSFNEMKEKIKLESDTHVIELSTITNDGFYCSGHLKAKNPDDVGNYMSTHTFYDQERCDFTSMMLQLCGFNVELRCD